MLEPGPQIGAAAKGLQGRNHSELRVSSPAKPRLTCLPGKRMPRKPRKSKRKCSNSANRTGPPRLGKKGNRDQENGS